MTCPDCGNDNPASARYCAGCGRALAEAMHPRLDVRSSDSPEGERKQASILAGEMLNRAELVERLGPEASLPGISAVS